MDSKALSSQIARFSARFCNELSKDKNVVSSPLSAEFVLALLTLGAVDPAHKELLTALGIPDNNAIRSSFTSVSSKLKTLKGVTLNVANRIYVKQGPHELDSNLQEDATKVFDAGIEKTDFSNGAAAAHLINQWVESKTNNKIKDLLSPDSLGEDTRLVLVNALYFKGTWKEKFNPNNTMDQPFHINAKKTVQVPMMFKEADFKLGSSEELGAQLLELPYEGGESSLLIVLPNELEGLNDVIIKLANGFDLVSELEKMYSTKVQVSIPKFKIETELDLKEILQKLGITSIFSRNSSGLDNILNPPQPLCVSKAVQKAFIEINEEGSEAAAATAMGLMMMCARIEPEPHRFVADRPYLAIIKVGDVPYFLATYRGPN